MFPYFSASFPQSLSSKLFNIKLPNCIYLLKRYTDIYGDCWIISRYVARTNYEPAHTIAFSLPSDSYSSSIVRASHRRSEGCAGWIPVWRSETFFWVCYNAWIASCNNLINIIDDNDGNEDGDDDDDDDDSYHSDIAF